VREHGGLLGRSDVGEGHALVWKTARGFFDLGRGGCLSGCSRGLRSDADVGFVV